jgi:hypothetical protein
MGGRLDYKLFDKIVMGATVLKEGGDKPSTVPQVGSYSKDLLVYGADINGKDIKLADPLSVDFSAEVAKSQKKQNLFGYAMVDSMNETTSRWPVRAYLKTGLSLPTPAACRRFWTPSIGTRRTCRPWKSTRTPSPTTTTNSKC